MASFHIATWNRRGKSLENLDRVGDLLSMGGFDLIGLQELGGCLDIPSGKWDTRVVWLQNISFSFVVGNPLGSHRCQAVGFPSILAPQVSHISLQPCGMCVQFRVHGMSTYLGLSHTIPHTYTWSNTRGSQSKIDYILYRTPHQQTLDMQVVEESDFILDSDHRLVTACVGLLRNRPRRQRQQRTKCGKWIVDYTKAVPALNELATVADLESKDLDESEMLSVASKSCFRPRRFRFVDSPEIKALIHSSDPLENRHLGREIVHRRAEAKKQWRTDLLDKAASGDYQAISYFRRKQAQTASQLTYCLRVRRGHRASSRGPPGFLQSEVRA